MATTDGIGVITVTLHFSEVPYIGGLSSIVSVGNDHSKLNVWTNIFSNIPEAGGAFAITGAFNDLFDYGIHHSQPLNNWQTAPYIFGGSEDYIQPLGPQGGGGGGGGAAQPSCELDGNCPPPDSDLTDS